MNRRQLKKQLAIGLRANKQYSAKGINDPEFTADLIALDRALTADQLDEATIYAKKIAERVKAASARPWWYKGLEFVGTLIAAIAIAGLVRQTWFELYEIPTGSMRPSFKEKDRVLVSKSTFGINIPFTTGHVAFSPDRLKRGAVVVITAEGLDVPDVDTLYFGVFPGKKRYVKRLVALPGDWVYFYGGDLFCVSADGKTLHRLQSDPSIPPREYLPFLGGFEGRVEAISTSHFSRQKTYLLKHFNRPIGRIEVSSNGRIDCRIPQDDSWVHEFTPVKQLPHPCPRSFGEFWGLNNFAQCRLLLPQELPPEAIRLGYNDPSAIAWLEFHHSPTLPASKKLTQTSIRLVNSSTTWIPLRAEQCERLKNTLYTARVTILNNHLRRYHYEPHNGPSLTLPKEIPSGTYEFYNGKALKIGFGGLASTLPPDHPIYPNTIKELAFWFNAGIDVLPEGLTGDHLPTRFAYYRDKDLYVMGAPIFFKDDPVLKYFEAQEATRQAKDYSYFAFQDMGSPELSSPDLSFFKQFGYKVPERQYLLLGDNPAMSLDCRFFGPVPEENIQGTPILLFWPFGDRWGIPEQPPLLPSVYSVVFCLMAAGGLTAYRLHQRRVTQRLLEELRKIQL